MLVVDLERSLFEHLAANLPAELRVHLPGEEFSPERAKEWIEPRILAVERSPLSGRGRVVERETDRMLLQIRCFVKVWHKGDRPLELSTLVDSVRAVVDSTLFANAAIVYDGPNPGPPTPNDIGRIQFGPAQETRAYDVTLTVGEVDVPGLDMSTLTVTAPVTGDP